MKRLPLLVLAALCGGAAQAGILTGQVTGPNAAPVGGATVTVFSADGLRKESVYTADDGSYAIVTDFGGKLKLRSRIAGLADSLSESSVGRSEAVRFDFAMKPHASAAEASDALPASAHNARLPWASSDDRKPFVSQCMYCHQVGNALTRSARPQSAWEATILRMEGYLGMLTGREVKTISSVLAKGFDGKPVEAIHRQAASAELARGKVEQWLVGDAMSFIHDADVGEDDKLYGTDEGHDIIWVLDRKTHKIEKYPLPDIDLPAGGKFAGMQLPIGIFTGKHGPHSTAQTRDGRFWITAALSGKLLSFHPKTKQFKTYDVPGDVLYPHTIRADRQGMLWFTNVASNQVTRFDPATEQMTTLRLPHNGFFRWVTDMLFPSVLKLASWFPGKNLHLGLSHHKWLGHSVMAFPYGIDVNPVDGSIWYAKLYASKIGRIDPKTLEITEYDTPMKGPRRPRFAPDGILWIPAFDDSGLMSFDPKTAKFTSRKLPVLAANEHEVPYALNVHPQTGEVWIAANNSDRMLRYFPKSDTFLAYPSPTRVTVLRDWVFTKDGRACSSTSNLPAYGMEDGVDSFICVDPSGGEKDRMAALEGKR